MKKIMIGLAAWLLRRVGATVEYRVQRKSVVSDTGVLKDGRTVLRVGRYNAALAKFWNMRIADTDTLFVRMVVTVDQRKVITS